jgi:hypothetical protein
LGSALEAIKEKDYFKAHKDANKHQKCKTRWYLWGIKYHPAMSR